VQNSLNEEDVEVIQRQLRDKENKLTDVRLEALASAHHLEQLKDEFLRMKVNCGFVVFFPD
jgi:hypothetical protein